MKSTEQYNHTNVKGQELKQKIKIPRQEATCQSQR